MSSTWQACDARLCFLFNAAPTVDPFTAEAAPTSNVAARWLAVADRYRLRRLLPLAAEKVLRSMTVLPVSKSEGKDWKSMIEELGGASLSAGTWQLLFEGMARAAAAVQAQGYSSCKLNDHIPNTFKSWSKPGDLF